MTKALSLRERISASSGADAPVKSGRPHSFDRDFSPLVDVPLHSGMTQRQRVAALSRLLCIKEATQKLAFAASDAGLAASWLRLSSIEDDVGDAVEKVTAAITDARSR
jgi:hypothetical protein